MSLAELQKQDKLDRLKYNMHEDDNWINKGMQSNQYKVVRNKGNGDCFFFAIADAVYNDASQNNVRKLRTMLADRFTEQSLVRFKDVEMQAISSLRTKWINVPSKQSYYNVIAAEKQKIFDAVNKGGLVRLKEHVMTNKFWADEYSVNPLEKALNLKIIILSMVEGNVVFNHIDPVEYDDAHPIKYVILALWWRTLRTGDL